MNLQEKIEKYKQALAQYEEILNQAERDLFYNQEKLKELKTQLKDEFGIEEIDSVQEMISNLEKEISEEEIKLQKLIEEYNRLAGNQG